VLRGRPARRRAAAAPGRRRSRPPATALGTPVGDPRQRLNRKAPPMFRPDIIAPASIEEESFRIIEAELSPHFGFSPQQHLVVRRVIHATADFEYARMLRFHPGAFAAFKA